MSVALKQGGMRCAIALASCFLMSCLVTDRIEAPAPEPNRPPSIVSAPCSDVDLTNCHPLDQIVRINRDEAPADLELNVIIRDPDVDDNLAIQVYVDYVDNLNSAFVPQSSQVLEGTGTLERSVTITVPVGRLGLAGVCHKIELLVSKDFKDFPAVRDPVEDIDLAQAVWWVSLTDTSNPGPVLLETCRY